jgi:hypothetical protein
MPPGLDSVIGATILKIDGTKITEVGELRSASVGMIFLIFCMTWAKDLKINILSTGSTTARVTPQITVDGRPGLNNKIIFELMLLQNSPFLNEESTKLDIMKVGESLISNSRLCRYDNRE